MTADDSPSRKRVESLDDVARAPDAVVNPELDQFLAACATQLRDRGRLQRRAGGAAPGRPTWPLVADVLYAACHHY
ncbi:hypothetical protein [Micromonospora sp. DT47]|uniref:hypothetical protein n=1 Tax=Micromonospora sp. DT47 TaxID=3393431 RepID=UPI003CF32D53